MFVNCQTISEIVETIMSLDCTMNRLTHSIINIFNVAFQCRERGVTYKGPLNVLLGWKVNGVSCGPVDKVVGHIPIMVKVRNT